VLCLVEFACSLFAPSPFSRPARYSWSEPTPEATAAVATSFTRFNLNTATYYHPALGKQADVTFPQTAPNRAN